MSLIRIILNTILISYFIYSIKSMNLKRSFESKPREITYCQLSSGEYIRCPILFGECCADGLYCCLNGTNCQNKENSCHPIRDTKKLTHLTVVSKELCPDKNQSCHRYETCCKEKSGSYGCCPYNLGVCCKDMVHCCPHATICDLIHRQCVRPSNQINDKRGFSGPSNLGLSLFQTKNIKDIICADSRHNDSNTSLNKSEELRACPLSNGVCCKDQKHCCPEGYKCLKKVCQKL